MFRRTVPVVDLENGKIVALASTTMTLDVPADFDRDARVASVDFRARAHYRSTNGSTLVNLAHPRPLSWRVRGEECLVAGGKSGEDGVEYRLCTVDPGRD